MLLWWRCVKLLLTVLLSGQKFYAAAGAETGYRINVEVQILGQLKTSVENATRIIEAALQNTEIWETPSKTAVSVTLEATASEEEASCDEVFYISPSPKCETTLLCAFHDGSTVLSGALHSQARLVAGGIINVAKSRTTSYSQYRGNAEFEAPVDLRKLHARTPSATEKIAESRAGQPMGFNFGNGGGLTLPDGTTFNFGGGGGVYIGQTDSSSPLDSFAGSHDSRGHFGGGENGRSFMSALAQSLDFGAIREKSKIHAKLTDKPCLLVYSTLSGGDTIQVYGAPRQKTHDECWQACLPRLIVHALLPDGPVRRGRCDGHEIAKLQGLSFEPIIPSFEVSVFSRDMQRPNEGERRSHSVEAQNGNFAKFSKNPLSNGSGIRQPQEESMSPSPIIEAALSQLRRNSNISRLRFESVPQLRKHLEAVAKILRFFPLQTSRFCVPFHGFVANDACYHGCAETALSAALVAPHKLYHESSLILMQGFCPEEYAVPLPAPNVASEKEQFIKSLKLLYALRSPEDEMLPDRDEANVATKRPVKLCIVMRLRSFPSTKKCLPHVILPGNAAEVWLIALSNDFDMEFVQCPQKSALTADSKELFPRVSFYTATERNVCDLTNMAILIEDPAWVANLDDEVVPNIWGQPPKQSPQV